MHIWVTTTLWVNAEVPSAGKEPELYAWRICGGLGHGDAQELNMWCPTIASMFSAPLLLSWAPWPNLSVHWTIRGDGAQAGLKG